MFYIATRIIWCQEFSVSFLLDKRNESPINKWWEILLPEETRWETVGLSEETKK